jgi:hypothetical protein
MKYPVLLTVTLFSALTGCRTLTQLPTLEGSLTARSGQLRYASPTRSVIGDVVLRAAPSGDFDLEFSKGVSLLVVQARDDRLRATGALAGSGWSGSVQRAPAPLQPWATLRQILPLFSDPRRNSARTNRWSAVFQRRNGVVTRAEIEFTTGERMTFYFGS